MSPLKIFLWIIAIFAIAVAIFYYIGFPRKMTKQIQEQGSLYEKLGNQEKLWEWIEKNKK